MKKALFYKTEQDKKVKCLLCPHNCVISDGKLGFCKVRQNIDGTLYSLNYGNLIAVHVDPMEKKPLYHFFPGAKTLSVAAPGCNFKCLNCQNYTISQPDNSILKAGRQVSPEEIVYNAKKAGLSHITFTYTEPTVFFEYMLDIAKLAKQSGITCSMVSNGYINPQPLEALIPYIEAANIDLKFADNENYGKIAKGRLTPVLNTVKTLFKNGIITEITTLIIPGINDDENYFGKLSDLVLAISDTLPWHISAFYPAYKMANYPPASAETVKKLRKLALRKGIKYVYTGNIPDKEGSSTFCSGCGNIVIERFYYSVMDKTEKGFCPFCGEKIYGKFS